MAANSTIAVDDDADGHPALSICRTEAIVRLHESYHIAKAQIAKAITLSYVRISQLNVIVSPPSGILAQSGTHDRSWYKMRHRSEQHAVAFSKSPTHKQVG
jgi:hypothetical protein